MIFAKNVKHLMKEMGMTQKELCEKIGKNKSSVSQYLSGTNLPRLEVQEKIADALCTTVECLHTENAFATSKSYNNRMSIKEAARLLEQCEQAVRVAIVQGKAPYGYAFKSGKNYSYHISRAKMYEYLGINHNLANV